MLHPKVLSLIKAGHSTDAAFEGFWDLIKPKEFPPNQPIEMRKAWFCGAFAMMNLLANISESMPEEQSVKLLDKIDQELKREIKQFAYPFNPEFFK